MLTVGYLESLRYPIPAPEWARTERFDYCDQGIHRGFGILRLLSQLFHR